MGAAWREVAGAGASFAAGEDLAGASPQLAAARDQGCGSFQLDCEIAGRDDDGFRVAALFVCDPVELIAGDRAAGVRARSNSATTFV
jgi:hypothetical protein